MTHGPVDIVGLKKNAETTRSMHDPQYTMEGCDGTYFAPVTSLNCAMSASRFACSFFDEEENDWRSEDIVVVDRVGQPSQTNDPIREGCTSCPCAQPREIFKRTMLASFSLLIFAAARAAGVTEITTGVLALLFSFTGVVVAWDSGRFDLKSIQPITIGSAAARNRLCSERMMVNPNSNGENTKSTTESPRSLRREATVNSDLELSDSGPPGGVELRLDPTFGFACANLEEASN
ncbi:hypothetical protein DL93DRAFT_241802 [Clavulina sp. PMI_390]|nr:hypothetical protein DL93DRAFT_241802 [Clavulina sp. PMI_390]